MSNAKDDVCCCSGGKVGMNFFKVPAKERNLYVCESEACVRVCV